MSASHPGRFTPQRKSLYVEYDNRVFTNIVSYIRM